MLSDVRLEHYAAKLNTCGKVWCHYDMGKPVNHYNTEMRSSTMPRPKGSKNKPKTVTADFASQIAEKQSARESLLAEITSITANIDTLEADLKEKKTALKAAQKELTKLEAKKAAVDQKAAEATKKSEAEAVLKKLLAEGVSADDIIEKLK